MWTPASLSSFPSPIAVLGAGLLVAGSATLGCSPSASSGGPLTVLAAASAGLALRDVAGEGPLASIRVELCASRAAISQLRDLRPGALVVTADAGLFEGPLREGTVTTAVSFATNSLVLAYHPGSPGGRALAAGDPWQLVLNRAGVVVGAADPKLAPAGYRALRALALNDEVAAPEMKTGAAIAKRIVRERTRPDVAKLIAPLQAGEFDAAFVYRSDAVQAKLAFVPLDPRIDFSGGENQVRYAIGLPPTRVRDPLARSFVKALLSPAGAAALRKRGLIPLSAESQRWQGAHWKEPAP